MLAPAKPINEEDRINDLYHYNVLDTPEEKDFNDLTELAAQICNCPYALISFIDKDRQWIKATKENQNMGFSRDISFCGHTILKTDVMVIKDCRKDIRFHDNPNVIGGVKIAFYAGSPIISAAGFALGTVCVIDTHPRQIFTVTQKKALKIIAAQVSTLLDLKLKISLSTERGLQKVAAEKRLAQLAMVSHEKEKAKIAFELHENFAQTLAGIKFYLDFAENSKEKEMLILQKSKEYINDLISDVRVLSKSIVPTTFDNDNYIDIIKELAEKFYKDNGISVKIKYSKDFRGFDTTTGLSIFRIIENQLQIAKNATAKNVKIRISQESKISISFKDDGQKNVSFYEKELLVNNIITSTEFLKGKLIKDKNLGGKNVLVIEIPLNCMLTA